MPCILTSRRSLVALAGRAVLSAAAIGSLSKEAAAEQGNMEAALRALHSALESLRAATPIVASLMKEQKREAPAFLGMTDNPHSPQPTSELWIFESEHGLN